MKNENRTVPVSIKDLEIIKKAYVDAVKEGREVFDVFIEGGQLTQLYTPYAKYLVEYYDSLHDDDNLCGKPHNNAEPTCLECEVIRHNI
jgi:hypothetical protein